MKKLQAVIIISLITGMTLTGCTPGSISAGSANMPAVPEDVSPASVDEGAKPSEAESSPEPENSRIEEETPGTSGAEEESSMADRAIVWLGDSLTQGSLGEEDDNLSGAPYKKLAKLINNPVEGYGLYGYNTHDVLFEYTDKDHLAQTPDPEKIYIFWLGSNDWVTDAGENRNSDTAPVIKQIDDFLASGNINDYIVMGTTSRHRLGDLYIPINRDLEEHYAQHYLDVIETINRYGYSPDNTHLSQDSYDAIALSVRDKLEELGYIDKEQKRNTVKGQPIVWLGDSLTQGSLGDNNDNLPGAPYEKLKTLVDVPVEGLGLYGAKTHDIFWIYIDRTQMNQIADPTKTYIFWVGSNDWVNDEGVNSDTGPVIDEIDRFLHLEGAIDNYIVIGTTSRPGLEELCHDINRDLEDHYKEHYLDVLDIINRYGYSPDKTHLSQETYDAVADAVYEKLIELGYI